jgi:hypothetical protein
MSYQIGWVHVAGWLLALLALNKFWKTDKKRAYTVLFASGAILLAVLMIHPRSEFIWKLFDSLKYVQFPWRFLLLVIFFISFVSGGIFFAFQHHKRIKWLWIGLVILVVVLNFAYFRPQKFYNYSSDKEILTGPKFEHYKMYAIFDYLPKSAEAPPAGPAPAPYEVITGNLEIKDFAQGSNWMRFTTFTKTHTILRLSQYYFPEWKIKIDGIDTKFDYKSSLGLMTILLGKGNHTVEAQLHDTPIRTLGNLISSLGFIAFALLTLLSFEKGRKRLAYYLKAFNR